MRMSLEDKSEPATVNNYPRLLAAVLAHAASMVGVRPPKLPQKVMRYEACSFFVPYYVIYLCFIMSSPPDSVSKGLCFKAIPLSCLFILSFVRFIYSSGHILLARYLMNALNNFDTTDRKYSLATTDDLFRFWRSNVRCLPHSGPHSIAFIVIIF